jgi:4-amino-4-deoxy-L-arabinose transferase-like glycosyltransferase
VIGFGLLFFSASKNKLPSYLLPLIPPLCIAMAAGLSAVRRPKLFWIASAVLLGAIPFAAAALPFALASRVSGAPMHWTLLAAGFGAAAIGSAALALVPNRLVGVFTLLAAGISFTVLQFAVFPEIDRAASARPAFASGPPGCASESERGFLYGLYYYADRVLPNCAILNRNPR